MTRSIRQAVADTLGRPQAWVLPRPRRPGRRGTRPPLTDANSLGHTNQYKYNEAYRVVRHTDPLGASTRQEWDRDHQLTAVINPLGHATRYRYDDGRVVAVVRPDGQELASEYDALGLPTTITGPDGAVWRQEYDEHGDRTAVTDPAGATTRFTYNRTGHLTSATDALGNTTRVRCDRAGLPVEITDPLGAATRYTRDNFGRPGTITDALGNVTCLEWSTEGKPTRRIAADGTSESWEYDAEGNCVTHFDALGAVTRFEYTHFDLLTARIGPDGVRHAFTYDTELRITYEYDLLGRRTQRTTPTGATSRWSYDAADRRTLLNSGGHRINFVYDSVGRELSRLIDTTATLAHTFDDRGRLTSQYVRDATGADIQRRDYTYRGDNSLVRLDDRLNGTRHFDLDAAGRVTAVHATDWTERYVYDEAGNQTDASWPAAHPGQEATGPRAYAGTRLTRAGSIRYEHDAAGRIMLRQKTRLSRKSDTWNYTWNSEDRLTSVVTPDGTQWRYLYDPLGRRIAKQRLAADGVTVVEQTHFTWDGATLCEQTTTAAELPRPVTLTWDHQGLRPIAQTERVGALDAPQDEIDSRFFAIVTDLVGTPTELLDESGTIVWHTRTTLWGATSWTADSTTYTPLRFPGQYFDPETGLHYNYHRHYDPETARYLTPDPLGLAPAPNPSTYIHNPHIWTDPLGLAPRCDDDLINAYRKQTDHPLSKRIHIGEDGSVTITGQGALYVNLSGDIGHTVRFRGEGGQIVEFQISADFREKIRRTAIPQEQPDGLGFTKEEWRKPKKICPEISDPTMGDDLYGIPSGMLNEFREEVAKYPGRVVKEG